MKWLNYHVVIDERRGCGQEKKNKQQKNNLKKQLHLFLLAVFALLGLHVLSLYRIWAKTH